MNELEYGAWINLGRRRDAPPVMDGVLSWMWSHGVPGDPGFATLSQGYLESSNVDPVKEIADLIQAQRAYEMNSKVIQAADQMGETLSKGIR